MPCHAWCVLPPNDLPSTLERAGSKSKVRWTSIRLQGPKAAWRVCNTASCLRFAGPKLRQNVSEKANVGTRVRLRVFVKQSERQKVRLDLGQHIRQNTHGSVSEHLANNMSQRTTEECQTMSDQMPEYIDVRQNSRQCVMVGIIQTSKLH